MSKFKNWIIMWIWFVLVLWIVNAWVWLEATTWDILTADKWNELVNKVEWPGSTVQTVIRTSSVTSSLDVETFTEANSDYRINFTPKYSNSKILVEYYFSINTAMDTNTIFHMQLVRNIGWSETVIWIWPINWDRNRTTYVSRPSNGYDVNDMQSVYMLAEDLWLTAWENYIYGFKYRRENWGNGACYFNASNWNTTSYWFSWVMTMKITEIKQ